MKGLFSLQWLVQLWAGEPRQLRAVAVQEGTGLEGWPLTPPCRTRHEGKLLHHIIGDDFELDAKLWTCFAKHVLWYSLTVHTSDCVVH